MQEAIFYVLCALTVLSVTGILLIKNLFKAVLLFLICLLSLAGIYVLSFAEFVAVTQILIYAGGIIVLLLFGIMLTTKMAGVPLRIENTNIFATILAATGLLGVLTYTFVEYFTFANVRSPAADTVRDTGIMLMTSYLLHFEIAGVLLLVALIGAAVVSTTDNLKKR